METGTRPRERKVWLVRNAEIMPFQGSMLSYSTGVFAGEELIPESLLTRRGKESLRYCVEKRLPGTYVWGGCLFAHYGHFILESLAHLHAIRQCPDLPVIFLNAYPRFNETYRVLFKFLRITSPCLIVNRPLGVEKLLFSTVGSSVSPPLIHDEQLKALQIIKGVEKNLPEKIWLSRSEFPGGTVAEEVVLQAALERQGWTIIHPEKLPHIMQARLISSAKYVAGFDGSAFYSLLFAAGIRGRFFVFSRRNAVPDMLRYVLNRRQLPFEEHVLKAEFLSGWNAASRYSIPEWERIPEILAESTV